MTQAGQPDFSGGVSEIFFLLELLSGSMGCSRQILLLCAE